MKERGRVMTQIENSYGLLTVQSDSRGISYVIDRTGGLALCVTSDSVVFDGNRVAFVGLTKSELYVVARELEAIYEIYFTKKRSDDAKPSGNLAVFQRESEYQKLEEKCKVLKDELERANKKIEELMKK